MVIKRGEQILVEDILNLTFLPKGTILMYDGQLWDRTGGIPGWHVCNGENGTIDLRDKFIRGSTTARQTGGTDTAKVPYHNHSFTGNTETGTLHIVSGGNVVSGVFSSTYDGGVNHITTNVSGKDSTIKFSMTPSGTISYAGVNSEGDNRPVFCTVIFIEKITAYLS